MNEDNGIDLTSPPETLVIPFTLTSLDMTNQFANIGFGEGTIHTPTITGVKLKIEAETFVTSPHCHRLETYIHNYYTTHPHNKNIRVSIIFDEP